MYMPHPDWERFVMWFIGAMGITLVWLALSGCAPWFVCANCPSKYRAKCDQHSSAWLVDTEEDARGFVAHWKTLDYTGCRWWKIGDPDNGTYPDSHDSRSDTVGADSASAERQLHHGQPSPQQRKRLVPRLGSGSV